MGCGEEKTVAHVVQAVMDAIVNHTGPVTPDDPVWPDDWVRTAPKCEFDDYETTVTCTLVENLPDILTESDEEVDLKRWTAREIGDEIDRAYARIWAERRAFTSAILGPRVASP